MIVKPKSRKPLVYWCRWHNAILRLRGRTDTEVWGDLFYESEGKSDPFRYDLVTWVLTYGSAENSTTIELDEQGTAQSPIP